jgi:hypothetical protein
LRSSHRTPTASSAWSASRNAADLAIHQTLAHGGAVLEVGGDRLGGEGVGALLRF